MSHLTSSSPAGETVDIRIADVALTDTDIDAAVEALRSGTLAQGPRVAELEAAWAHEVGTKFALAVNSGTAAIHSALHALGVGPGDEVVTVPFSFVGTVSPILMLGAEVRFVDIRPDDFTLDAEQLPSALSSRTKAIVAVDLFGQAYDADEVADHCAELGIPVVEDACQAIGASYKGRPAGSLADVASFSLYATKNLTCGEGGVVTTDRTDVFEAVRLFRQHGALSGYDYTGLGYNYRLTEVAAAIARAQLHRLRSLTTSRVANAAALTERLTGIPGLVLPIVKPDRTHVFHQYTVRVTDDAAVDRDSLQVALRRAGIQSGVYYPRGLHRIPHIAKSARVGHFPETDRASTQVLSLPVHPGLREADIDRIADAVRTTLSP